ncbi:hypothetical protein FQN57_004591 [Myotisia sp. PD_48]|nr:hypothetical protein FQN57_004591 [Myotisia sp. PD_48]
MDLAGYTVGWIAPLPLELTAARGMFEHGIFKTIHRNGYSYDVGKIGQHFVVMAVQSKIGTDEASGLATRMLSVFKNIEYFLVVGIGGGVPSYGLPGARSEIVLGDVVVSFPIGKYGGVVRYDFGAWTDNGDLTTSGHLNGPRGNLLSTVNSLRTCHQTTEGTDISRYLCEMRSRVHVNERQRFHDPGDRMDRLFPTDYPHPDKYQGKGCEPGCDFTKAHDRQYRGKEASRKIDSPKIHYGNIGSSNQLQLSANMRNRLLEEHDIICFEMEGAGVIQTHNCLVIRGICDYSDSHQTKAWQAYAAATAAAYAKEFLSKMPKSDNTKYYFKGDRLKIERLSGALLNMAQCYINLTIIEHKYERRRQSQLNASKSDRISLLSLFDERKPGDKTVSPQRIFIRGCAGVGKTTLCKKIVHDYYLKGMWKQRFDSILWVPLRRLKIRSRKNEYKDLGDMFRGEYYSHPNGKILATHLWEILRSPIHSRRILFLLDGVDEISHQLNDETDTSRLLNELLEWPQVIVTSRPLGVSLLKNFDIELETVGFESDQVDEYIFKTFNANGTSEANTIATAIRSFLQSRPVIQGLVRIPILLDALCFTWNNKLEEENIAKSKQMSTTMLYHDLELKLWKKDIVRLERKDDNGQFLTNKSVESYSEIWQIENFIGKERVILESLAFTGLYNNTLEFGQGFRNMLYKEFKHLKASDNILAKLSFLRSSEMSSQDTKRKYHFLHPSFQEYFAARYFIRCWRAEEPLISTELDDKKHTRSSKFKMMPRSFLQLEKYNGHYNTFWRFVSGLLYLECNDTLLEFFEELESEPLDLLGPPHQRLLIHCLTEVPCYAETFNSDNIRGKIEDQCKRWSSYES